MKKKKSNQKKFKKEDIFGLKSYTDGAKMWKFITSELDPTNTSISFKNDIDVLVGSSSEVMNFHISAPSVYDLRPKISSFLNFF